MPEASVTNFRWRRIGAISLSLIVIAILLFNGCSYFFQETVFDYDAWHNEELVDRGIRLRMGDHLVASGILLGKRRAEVTEMLGSQIENGKFFEWDLVYWLGRERAYISIDSEWLVIRLGPDARVVEARIVSD